MIEAQVLNQKYCDRAVMTGDESSFPFFNLARRHNKDYRCVLELAADLDRQWLESGFVPHVWIDAKIAPYVDAEYAFQADLFITWNEERLRRADITVVG
jgi:hypothetical protein